MQLFFSNQFFRRADFFKKCSCSQPHRCWRSFSPGRGLEGEFYTAPCGPEQYVNFLLPGGDHATLFFVSDMEFRHKLICFYRCVWHVVLFPSLKYQCIFFGCTMLGTICQKKFTPHLFCHHSVRLWHWVERSRGSGWNFESQFHTPARQCARHVLWLSVTFFFQFSFYPTRMQVFA